MRGRWRADASNIVVAGIVGESETSVEDGDGDGLAAYEG